MRISITSRVLTNRYSNLKKLYRLVCIPNDSVYALEKQQVQAARQPLDAESQALLADPNAAADEKLCKALDKELNKIVEFYKEKEEELKAEYDQLVADELEFQHELEAASNVIASGSSNVVGQRNSRGSLKKGMRRTSTGSLEAVDEGSSDEDSPTTPRPGTGLSALEGSQEWNPAARRSTESAIYGAGALRPHIRRSSMVFVEDDPYSDYTISDSRITMKKRAISSYVSLCELKSYVQLNWTGFSKLLKKYDKTCNRNLRRTYLSERVEKEHPFLVETREALNEKISNVQEIYARTWTDGDVIAAQKELKLHLREHVVWERNTVWRDMIGIERKAQAAALGIRSTLLGRERTTQDGSDEETKEIEVRTPVGKIKLPRWCPRWLFSASMATLLISIGVFFVLIVTPTFKSVEQSNCLAMLVFVSILWATEVCMLFSFSDVGHSPLRNIPPRPNALRTPSSPTNRRQRTRPSPRISSNKIHLLSNVDSSNHAPPRRFRNRSCPVKIRHRKINGNIHPLQSRDKTS